MKNILSKKEEAKHVLFDMVEMYTLDLAYGDDTSECIMWYDDEKQGHIILSCNEMDKAEAIPSHALHIPLKKVVRYNRNGRLVPNITAIKEEMNRWHNQLPIN